MVQLSVFTEIHKVQFTGFDDLIDKSEKKAEENRQLTFSEKKSPEVFYFMKTSDIFPVDIDVDASGSTSFLKRLRPEFLIDFEKPLSADAFMNTVESVETEKDDIDIAEAGKHLRTTVVQNFVRLLDDLVIMPIDSTTLTQV